MIIHDRKKVTSIILSRLKPSGQTESAPVKNEESDSPLHAIAKDMLLAFETKSASDLAQALEAAFQVMDQSNDEAEEQENPVE